MDPSFPGQEMGHGEKGGLLSSLWGTFISERSLETTWLLLGHPEAIPGR